MCVEVIVCYISVVFLRHGVPHACGTYATSMTSVCPSLTLVDCDHTVQEKCKSANNRIGRCLDPDHSIL